MASRLRRAGAIILGKSNLSQWANFRSTNSSNGWSAHGGQVLGAYVPGQDPSGSSSGSGVAAALGLAAACLGTETDGSIVSPASRSNVVGIKPTVGLTSRDLVVPISEHQDTVGPLAKTVRDAAILLQAIAGADPAGDNYTTASPFLLSDGVQALPNYVAATLRPNALAGARIGVPRNIVALFGNDSAAEVRVFESEALAVLRSAGADVVDPADFSAAEELAQSDAETVVLNADFISNLAAYLAKLSANPSGVRSVEDVRRFTRVTPAELFPDRNTATWDVALSAFPLEEGQTTTGGFNNTDPRFWTALQENLSLGGEGGLLGVLDRLKLDAIVLPSSFAPHWAAIVGAPIVAVPMGHYESEEQVVMNGRGDLVDTGPGVP